MSQYDTLLDSAEEVKQSPYDKLLEVPANPYDTLLEDLNNDQVNAPPVSEGRRADVDQYIKDNPIFEKSLWQVMNTTPNWFKNSETLDWLEKQTGIYGAIGGQKGTEIATGINKGVRHLADSIVTPLGLATLGIGGAPKIVQKLVATAFAANMAKHLPDTVEAIGSAKTTEERATAVTEAIGSGLMLTGLGKALAGRSAPLTSEALDATKRNEAQQSITDSAGSSEGNNAQRRAEDGGSGALPAGAGQTRSGPDAPELYQTPQRSVESTPANDLLAPETAAITQPKSGKVTQLLERRQKVTDPVERQKLWDEAQTLMKEMPQGPGKMTVGELEPTEPIGTHNAKVDEQRAARGLEPLMSEARKTDPVTWDAAENKIEKDPEYPARLVDEIQKGEKTSVSDDEQASLLWRMVDLRNKRELESIRGGDENLSPAERAEADAKADFYEKQLQATEEADRKAGTLQGRALRFRQVMANEDFTLANMERRARTAKGEALTSEERATIQKQADEIAALTKEVEGKMEAERVAKESQEIARVYEQTIKELEGRQKFGKEVFDIAHGIVNRWKEQAAESSKALRQAMGQTNIGVDPTLVLHAAKIIRAKIGEFGLNKAEAFTQMVAEFGENIKPLLEEAWKKAQNLIGQEKNPKVREKVSKGVKAKGEKSPVDIAARAKAEATAGEPLSHKTVYDLARAHINNGVHGEDAVMKAVHNDLKESYGDLTERDVRRAFSEYGKAKFPSKEADKMELRELRTLVRLQESIDRETEGLSALRTGLQRDKATQAIREKQRQLNELLKKREGPPTPEQLATRDEAKKTALRNAIADLDKELRTGEKPTKSTPVPDSPEVERLRAERDAMREKLKEIEAEKNPPPSPEEQYNKKKTKDLTRRIKTLEDRIARSDYAPKPKPVQPALTVENQKAQFRLNELKKKFNEGVYNEKLKQRSTPRKIFEGGRDILNVARAVMTSFDLSAILRQGAFVGIAHPLRAARAIPDMLRALTSERKQFAINKEIHERPNAPLYQSSKLFLHDESSPLLSKMEEAYMSRWTKKIPGVAASERAYTTYLNRLRADSFDAMVEATGAKTPEELKAISNYINVATGRGNLAGASGAAISLNTAFFSPRFVVSRFELLAGQPLYKGSAATRIAIAKEYARFLIGLGVIYALGKSAGATVETDPTKSDFGKLRFGDTRVDLLAGLSQATVFEARFAKNVQRVLKGEKLEHGAGDFMGRFLRSKLSPAIGTAVDFGYGSNMVGEQVTATSAAQRMVIPMTFGDIYEAMKAQGVEKGTALSLLSIFGASVNTYPDKK